jgi:hypothetical protein
MGAFFLLALVAVLAGAVTAWWQCTRDERRAAKRAARAKAAQ